MYGKKKILAMAVLCAVASVGFVVPAGAEETMKHDLDEVIVEADRDTLPGGFISGKDRIGVFGDVDIIDVPFTQNRYTQKTIEMFEDPSQPLNGVLANNPSVRIGTTSTMYTDFKLRGVNMNANHYVLNGIPSLFNQSLSLPMYTLSSVELISGPNTVLNGSTTSSNGTNGTDAAPGILSATTKKATTEPNNRYTQIFSGRGNMTEQIDIGRRFGDKKEWGVRIMGRYQDGNTAIKGSEFKEKSLYMNIDHQDEKSTTNLFAGYFDAGTIGGQRWMGSASTLNHMPDAPDLSKNFSFDGQRKIYNGYLVTLNHEQKLDDDWTAFFNAGGNKYQEEKFDMAGGSPTLYDDGHFEKNLRHYKSRSSTLYYQGGIKGRIQTGAVKNNLVLAIDREYYRSVSANVEGGKYIGNLWDGVTSVGKWPGAVTLDGLTPTRENVVSTILADRIEYGKWSAYLAAQYRSGRYSNKTQSISKSALNPTYSLAYKPTDNMSVYASYATSFTRPYMVSSSYLNENDVFEPIKNKQTEIGIKYRTGKFLNTLSYFDLSQASYLAIDIPGQSKQLMTQDGENKFKGAEWIFTGELDKKWNIMGGLTYLNGKRENTAGHKTDGFRATGTPKWNAVLTAEYKPEEDTSLIGRIHFTDRMLINDNGVESPSFSLFDFGVRHTTKINSVPVTLSAMCYNAFGKNYFYGTSLGAPRTLMLSAQFDI